MSVEGAPPINTGMAQAGTAPIRELLNLREAGDSVLDHCIRRVVEHASSASSRRVAAFDAALPDRSR